MVAKARKEVGTMLTQRDVAAIAREHNLDAVELIEVAEDEFDGDVDAAVTHLLSLREMLHQDCECHKQ